MLINKETAKEKKWVVKAEKTLESEKSVRTISESLGINPIVAQLLFNRGYTTAEEAEGFLKLEHEMLCNPFQMKDMELGVKRLKKAIDNGEKITVYGDYDVDGVTAVCTLYLYLKSQGGNVDYYIPNRAGEGYGVSNPAIDQIKESGTKLIITVDTGITANEEVEYAKTVGVDFLVTDHHECRPELPKADAVINPHRPDCPYPFKDLAGVGVVFKLISAYEETYNEHDRYKATLKIMREYADLVAIGTIADVMPIRGENRIIVKYGLSMIENTDRLGLAALIDIASNKSDNKKADGKKPYQRKFDRYGRRKKKAKITSGFIGFTIAPRINAAGRVRSATLAVELFLSETEQEAYRIAEELCIANKERQAEENKIMQDAREKIQNIDINKNPVIVLDADNWHHGVIGIVSSRITEKYCRPSILVSFDGNEEREDKSLDVGKGSGRSIKGLNLVDALCYCQDLLVKFGGHELAAGLSVTRGNLKPFVEKINEYARQNLSEKDMVPVIDTDCEINFSDITMDLAEQIQLLEPFGVANPIPMFIMRGVNVFEINGVSGDKHTRLVFGDGNTTVSAMYFSNSPDSLGVYVGDKADVLFSIDINEWFDRKSVQLVVRDIKVSKAQEAIEISERERFEEIKNGAFFTEEENICPDRDDFISVYKLIQNSIHVGQDTLSHKDITSKLSSLKDRKKIGYLKLKFIIMVFKELNIIGIEEPEEELYRFELRYSTTKRNLDKSSILHKLHSQMR